MDDSPGFLDQIVTAEETLPSSRSLSAVTAARTLASRVGSAVSPARASWRERTSSPRSVQASLWPATSALRHSSRPSPSARCCRVPVAVRRVMRANSWCPVASGST